MTVIMKEKTGYIVGLDVVLAEVAAKKMKYRLANTSNKVEISLNNIKEILFDGITVYEGGE